jgi:hypothetical protein
MLYEIGSKYLRLDNQASTKQDQLQGNLNTPRPSMEDTWEGFSREFVEVENSFFQENIARGRSPNMEAARLTSSVTTG